MPGVDVAIPCFEHARFLRSCVASVLAQEVETLRVLIIDNASSDDSAAVARALAREHANVEVVVHETNLGPHASFNEGLDWARADYCMVLCSDDLLAPHALARMVAVLEDNPAASFAYGRDTHWVEGAPAPDTEAGGTTWRVRTGAEFIRERCRRPEQYIAAGMVLVRTSAQKAAGHYRPALQHTDDFEMLLRLARLGAAADTQAIVGIKRMHGTNLTHAFIAEGTRDLVERKAAIDSFFDHEGAALADAGRLRSLGALSIAERAYWCGVKRVAHGEFAAARAFFALAFRLAPRVAVLPPVNYLWRTERSLLDSIR